MELYMWSSMKKSTSLYYYYCAGPQYEISAKKGCRLFHFNVDRLRIIPLYINLFLFIAFRTLSHRELCIATYIEHPWCGAVKSPMALFLCFPQEGARPLPYLISNHTCICKHLILYYYSEGWHFFISSFSFNPHNYNDIYLQKWWCYWAN